MDDQQALEARPSSHPMPDEGTPDPRTWRLRVDGLVRRPRDFSWDELIHLGRAEHAGSFTCARGWSEGDLLWEGAPLDMMMDLVEPLPAATALYSYAPGYRALVPIDAARTAILATHLNGQPLTRERGAPCRLVVPDRSCQLSVKWVERIEFFTRRRDQPSGPPRPQG